MPAVQRVSDVNTGGAPITKGIDSVIVEGQPIAVVGSPVAPHGKHIGVTVAKGSSTVFAGGKPVAYTGAPDTCGDIRAGGAKNTIVRT